MFIENEFYFYNEEGNHTSYLDRVDNLVNSYNFCLRKGLPRGKGGGGGKVVDLSNGISKEVIEAAFGEGAWELFQQELQRPVVQEDLESIRKVAQSLGLTPPGADQN